MAEINYFLRELSSLAKQKETYENSLLRQRQHYQSQISALKRFSELVAKFE